MTSELHTPNPSVADIIADQNRTLASSTLRREIGPFRLVLMGVSLIVGAGVFVLTGTVAATNAGPAVALSFVLAALACAATGLCYAEAGAMLPSAGGGYKYVETAFGRTAGWLVAWALLLEYLFAASYVASGWAGYASNFLSIFGAALPQSLSTPPFDLDTDGFKIASASINLPAIVATALLTLVAIRGISTTAFVASALAILKVGVLLLFIIVGSGFVQMEYLVPFVPENTGVYGEFGWSGVVAGAAVLFVAFLGFDAIAANAQELKNPQRDLPIGVLGSLAVAAVLYVLVAVVLTGIAPYQTLNVANPLSEALGRIGDAARWIVPAVDLAAAAGLASVVLMLIVAVPRILYALARDGLLPGVFGKVDANTGVPGMGTVLVGGAVCFLSGFLPIEVLSRLVSLGALTVFVGVALATVWMRHKAPEAFRPFRTPLLPVVASVGAVTCLVLAASLSIDTWATYAVWMMIGIGVMIVMRLARKQNQ